MARVIAPGLPHHITQRGNGRRDVFLNDSLKRTYLDLLREQSAHHRLRILAYCLMTNHLHLVVIPETPHAIAGALRHAHGRFAQFWNTTQQHTGHMWQNRYYSCAMQPARVWSVIRYVELNPVRAGMVERAADYSWSSAAAHARRTDETGLLDMQWWNTYWSQGDWIEALSDEPGELDAIRRATYTGRPLGDHEFISDLERRTGRKLEPQKGGRPKKTQEGEIRDTIRMRVAGAGGVE